MDVLCFLNMLRLTKDERNRLVGILYWVASVATVAIHFNVKRRNVYVTRTEKVQLDLKMIDQVDFT